MSTKPIQHAPTLIDAKLEFGKGLHTGTDCPVCGRFAKIRKRNINKTMCKSLIWLVAEYQATQLPVHIQSTAPRTIVSTNQLSTLKYWGLVISPEYGMWQPTQLGIDFVAGVAKVPPYVFVFADELVSPALIGRRLAKPHRIKHFLK